MNRHRSDAGFSLAALIFFAAAASILAAAAVPAYQMQAKREREKELIFRGEEYTRAIQKYQRKFGVYPASIDQLVQTNGLRFLRRVYKDPITGKDFRLIRVNPDGSLSGSKGFQRNVNNPQPLFGNTQSFGQQQPGLQSQPGMQQQQLGMQQQQPGMQQQQPGMQQQLGPQAQQPGESGFSSGPQQLQQFSQPFGQPQGQSSGLSSFTAIGTSGFSAIGTAGGTPVAGGGLIGVASDSDDTSVMVYNQRQKYSEWEFVAIFNQYGTGPQRGQQPQPGGQSPAGQPANPFAGSPAASPFGAQPGASPFGPGPGMGQQQGLQPFGSANQLMPPGQPTPPIPGKLP